MATEDLNIKLAFTCEAEETVPVCLVQSGYGATSATHALIACDFGDIDQDRGGGDVISSDVV